jgi:hypothetical protein
MAGGTTDAAAGAGSAGKGLGWNQTELLAVARAAPVVLQSSTIGANQNTSMLARRLLAEFLRDECCPSVAECVRNDKSNLDSRRWHGRSALATWKCWTSKIKAPCVRLHAVNRRIHVAELTGGPYSDESMRRLATAIYNSKDGDGTHLLAHAYDILRNEHYVVGPAFPVPSAYDFLSKKTSLLADGMDELTLVVADGAAGGAAGADPSSNVAASGVNPISLGLLAKRPTSSGVKAAKAARAAKRTKAQAGPDDEPGLMTALVAAVSDLGSSRTAAQAGNTAALERQSSIQEADLRLRTSQVLYGEGSSASTDERQAVESAMRATFAQSVLAPPQPRATPAPASATTPETPRIPGTPSTPAHAAQSTAALTLTSFLPAGNGTTGIHLNLYDNDSDGADAR